MKPDVSVVMAVYNGERHLAAAIDSILAQTHPNFELIVVDDGSTDRSFEIASSKSDARVRIIRLPENRGLSAALNEGVQAASAPLAARQDADDLAEPNRLARQLAYMQSHPEVALLGTLATAIAEDGHITGKVERPIGRDSIRWFSIFDNPFIHTSVMFKTAAVLEAGGYDAKYDPFSQDYHLWCRVAERHAVANLPEPLVRYRVNEASIMGAVREDTEYSQRFDRVVRELTLIQARRIFGPAAIDDREAALLAGPVRGLTPQQVGPFLALFERLLIAFPRRSKDDDFNWTLARLLDAVAFRMRPSSRAAAARIYAHVFRRHPALLTHVSWPRTATLLLFGRSGRDRLGAWKRR